MATAAEPAILRPIKTRFDRFSRFGWAILFYNILVVLWGAYVRATGSGAGCGSHWPLCNGEILPRAPAAETIVEFTHRLTSGVALIAVVGLCVWAFRKFPRGHRVRLAAGLSVVFIFMEALLGAGLVLFRYVADNASIGRAVYLSAHLVNTQFLLAMLALTAWFARNPAERFWPRGTPKVLRAALPAALAVGVTGAIAALGDTLFPATSFASGLSQELSSDSHALLRLRLLHPTVAVLAGVYLAFAALSAIRLNPTDVVRSAGRMVAALVAIQLGAGLLNVALLAPVWMQLVHLLIANMIWIVLVILVVESAERPRGSTAQTLRVRCSFR